jgi:hypothetical protein
MHSALAVTYTRISGKGNRSIKVKIEYLPSVVILNALMIIGKDQISTENKYFDLHGGNNASAYVLPYRKYP